MICAAEQAADRAPEWESIGDCEPSDAAIEALAALLLSLAELEAVT